MLKLRHVLLAAVLLLVLLRPALAEAGVANAGIPGAPASNPLAGLPWGIYTGSVDGVFPAYRHARGRQRALLAKIARRPTMFWFGGWYSNRTVRALAQAFIANQTAGRSDTLAQVAVFRLKPWERGACGHTPSARQRSSYQRWVDNFAAGIGSSRVAMILQPDLPFALCRSPDKGRAQLALVSYAARVFSALPHTTVYIDAGARDWIRPGRAAYLLTHAGVGYTRGFALNDTHFDSTANELRFGAAVIGALARRGVRDKHFVINTAMNGRPFRFYRYHGRGDPPPCRSRRHRRRLCAALGIPPTWQVADPRWHLHRSVQQIASRYADAYLWVGRPWLDHGAWPFDKARALAMAASSRF